MFHRYLSLLSLYAVKVVGQNVYNYTQIPPAGPVSTLTHFGGVLSIQEFREGFLLADGTIIGGEKKETRSREKEPPVFRDKSFIQTVEVVVSQGKLVKSDHLQAFMTGHRERKRQVPNNVAERNGRGAVRQKQGKLFKAMEICTITSP